MTNSLVCRLEASHLQSGWGGLEVEVVSRQSAVVSAWAASPLKILVPRPRGLSVWAYLSSFGGGLVAGDETNVTLTVGPKARCFVSTQASTKVYRNPGFRPCGHRLKATLAEDSLLVLAPDPVQAFAGSGYKQRQEFHLQPRSGLVLLDWVCSGRVARGERWAFRRFQSRNEIMLAGQRLLLDSLLLDPADGPFEDPCRMGRYNCLALVLLLGEPLRQAAAALLESVAARPVPRRASLALSASPSAQGAVLRLAGENVEDVRNEIHRLLDFLPALLHDDPWQRKW